MNTVRSEDGLHPYFAVFVKKLANIKKVAYILDPIVHITPLKMAKIKGTKNKTKITQFEHNQKIIYVKLYGHKVVQSFYFGFSSNTLATEFTKQIQILLRKEIVN